MQDVISLLCPLCRMSSASISIVWDVIPLLCPLCRMSSADFQRKSPFPYFSILKNLHISNFFCTFAPEFVKLGNVSTALTKLSTDLRLNYHPP